MKKSILIQFLFLLFISSSLIGQDPCQSQKNFIKGQEVYLHSYYSNTWTKYIYNGPTSEGYELWADQSGRSLYMVNDLKGVYSQTEYSRLDLSKGACADCGAAYIEKFRNESLRLINDYRFQNGKSPLKNDPILNKAAQDYVTWAANNHSTFWPKYRTQGHSADGTTPPQRVANAAIALGIANPFPSAGENLTVGALCADDAFNSWKNSAGHARNMQSTNFEYVGLGIACGINAQGGKFLVAAQVFGPKKIVTNTPPNTNTGSENSTAGSGTIPSSVSGNGNSTGNTPNTNDFFNKGSTLYAGQSLKEGEALSNQSGSVAKVASNGDFILSNGARVFWTTATGSIESGGRLALQTDGNLVLSTKGGVPVWSSETHPFWNAKYGYSEWKPIRLVLEGTELTLYSATGNKVWTSSKGKIAPTDFGNTGSTTKGSNNNNPNTGTGSTSTPTASINAAGQKVLTGSNSCDKIIGVGIESIVTCNGKKLVLGTDNNIYEDTTNGWLKLGSDASKIRCIQNNIEYVNKDTGVVWRFVSDK